MDELQRLFQAKVKELQKLEQLTEKYLETAPHGTLQVYKHNKTHQFYWREDKTQKHGKYISKTNKKLIRELAQKEYAIQFQKSIHKQLKHLENASNFYDPNVLSECYESLTEVKQEFVNPFIKTNEQFIADWYECWNKKIARSKKVGFGQDAKEFYSDKGERVRSKSEMIIANKLNVMNIPYCYEVPITLHEYGIVHPDFVVLNVKTRKQFYWEHLGMMDDPEYCDSAIQKILNYERNKIYLGENLILSAETIRHPLNSKAIEMNINKYLQ